jgi:hypothetical protein
VAGMEAEVADIQAEELENIINNNVATKDDLKILELALKSDVQSLELELKSFMIKSLITFLGVLVTFQGFMTYFIKN